MPSRASSAPAGPDDRHAGANARGLARDATRDRLALIDESENRLLEILLSSSDPSLAKSYVLIAQLFQQERQNAENQLLVADGETAVIGGLTVTEVSQIRSGIPLLVDLPIIGKRCSSPMQPSSIRA